MPHTVENLFSRVKTKLSRRSSKKRRIIYTAEDFESDAIEPTYVAPVLNDIHFADLRQADALDYAGCRLEDVSDCAEHGTGSE